MIALNARGYDTLEEAQEAAKEHTLATLWYVSPRFYLARQPAIGDKVSMAFNGDAYPCGVIVRLTATKATTDTGHVFRKPAKRPIWREGSANGTFRMVFGHISERNPSF